jgi:hypothetical protein
MQTRYELACACCASAYDAHYGERCLITRPGRSNTMNTLIRETTDLAGSERCVPRRSKDHADRVHDIADANGQITAIRFFSEDDAAKFRERFQRENG